jgi:uncharacterized protein DUF2470
VNGALPVVVELTELSPVSTRERVRARVSLAGRLTAVALPGGGRAATLRIDVSEVTVQDDGPRKRVPLADYRIAEPDPLYLGAAEQLQHLAAHHPEAIEALARLCPAHDLIGVTRVIPVALDRYGIVLRIERLRGHRDVRLAFRERVAGGAAAAAQMRHLLHQGQRSRPCRP